METTGRPVSKVFIIRQVRYSGSVGQMVNSGLGKKLVFLRSMLKVESMGLLGVKERKVLVIVAAILAVA
jgi:hypothetical protein